MTLDPTLATLFERMAAAGRKPVDELPLDEARQQFLDGSRALLGENYAPLPLEDVHDLDLPGGPTVRRYRPRASRPLPTVLYCHGGGWVLGDLDSHDELCRHLAETLPAVVVSVDYRRAPEHPYPAALEDCWAALRWCEGEISNLGGDPAGLIVAGESAGGSIAAVLAQRARDCGGPTIAAQLLWYPSVDPATERASHIENAEGYFLTKAAMDWFVESYLPDPGDRTRPDAGPLHATSLEGLPPAIVVTAQFDVLRDEGDAFAAQLAAAGVPVRHLPCRGLAHGFVVGFPGSVPAAAAARDESIRALGEIVQLGAGDRARSAS